MPTLSVSPGLYIVPHSVVGRFVRDNHKQWLETPGKRGQPHRDSDMRSFHDVEGKYLDRWDSLGLGWCLLGLVEPWSPESPRRAPGRWDGCRSWLSAGSNAGRSAGSGTGPGWPGRTFVIAVWRSAWKG